MNSSVDVRALKDQAADLAARGLHRQAIQLYEQIALIEPDEPRWLLKIAESYRSMGDVRHAVRTYREASVAFARAGQTLKAIAACRVAIQLRPNDPETELLLQRLQARQDERSEPIERTSDSRPSKPPSSVKSPPSVLRKERTTLERLGITEKLPTRTPPDNTPDGEIEVELGGFEEVDLGYEEIPTSVPAKRTIDPVRVQGLPLLGPLPPEALADFLQRVDYITVAPGDRVITEGDRADRVFLVVSGDLIVTKGTPPRPIARLSEGAFFGEMALLDDAPRSASVVAVTDAELLVLPRELVLEICEQYPPVLSMLMQSLRARLTATLINTLPVFSGVPPAERPGLIERFRLRGIAPGVAILREGESSSGLYILLTGKADVIARGKIIATLTTGDVAGEMSLLSGGTARATVRTRTSVTALVLPPRDFQEIAMMYPQVLDQLTALSESRRVALEDNQVGKELVIPTVRRI